MNVVRRVENTPCLPGDKPVNTITISACGEFDQAGEDWMATLPEPLGGDKYADYPEGE